MSIITILFVATIPALAFWNYRLLKDNIRLSKANKQLKKYINGLQLQITAHKESKLKIEFKKVPKLKVSPNYIKSCIREIESGSIFVDDAIHREMIYALERQSETTNRS